MDLFKSYYNSPIGLVEVSADSTGITAVAFVEKHEELYASNEFTILCAQQLEEYFAGNRKEFNVSLSISGTDFQKKIWRQLELIPFGKTVSYLDIANALQSPAATRAIGNANSKNTMLIVLPCHRVIGNSGKLVGYVGELWRKKWLLTHEHKLEGGLEQLHLPF